MIEKKVCKCGHSKVMHTNSGSIKWGKNTNCKLCKLCDCEKYEKMEDEKRG